MALHELLHQYGYAFVLAAVLVEQVGVPIPAFAVLVVAGALVAQGALSAPLVLALAVVAALIGDYLWFQAGRSYGRRVVGLLCRLSIGSGDCVGRARASFGRFGLKALLVTRFVPGLAAAAPSLAGLSGYRRRDFAVFDLAGALLWASTALAIGIAFHREVDGVIGFLREAGFRAVAVAGAIALALLAVAAWRMRARLGRLGRTLWTALRGRASPCGCG